jgi:hypothetical protein
MKDEQGAKTNNIRKHTTIVSSANDLKISNNPTHCRPTLPGKPKSKQTQRHGSTSLACQQEAASKS